ncbi:MAG TPA: inorganic diphosphatase [Thermomicrobiales bacterium]|nr:inorganic diphosphatase [Thermomicrobiales bacterium]
MSSDVDPKQTENATNTVDADTEAIHKTAEAVFEEAGTELVSAFIEIPRGSRNKYEYDEETGVWHLDRVLYSSVHYPTDYGWVPNTLAEDGDHLDILVLVQEPTFPGCMIEARPLGGLDMSDEAGRDFKILAVPEGDPRFSHYQKLEDVGPHWLREIETFFQTYKLLEDKETEVLGWRGRDEAMRELRACRERYKQAGH